MFVLLGEVNLWTFDDDVDIKDTDFGAFRYYEKRVDGLYEEGKRSYSQKRGMVCVPVNKKGNKLKDSIRYLEEQLKDNTMVYCQWYDCSTISMMLSSGLLVQIQVNVSTGDVQKITFDKYLVGKVSDHISDVTITKNHLVCAYNDSQVTLVHFSKPKRHVFDKISRLEPKLSVIDLSGPSGRRLDKKIQVNRTGDLILIWWKSTMNEVYPWSPNVREHDRANVHLYRLSGTKIELLCYLRTEFDPLCIMFNARHDNVIHSVEQKVSRKGEVTIEWRTYEVSQQDKLQRIAVISVPLPTHTSCVKFSPNQDVLLLCCIDGSIMLHDQVKGTSNSVKTAFIPTLASWHNDGIIFAVGNERGQIQHFDISLSCVKNQMLSEDTTPVTVLDMSTYFRNQPVLLRMEWNKKTDPTSCTDHYSCEDSVFLLLFERGPLGIFRIIEGNHFTGDVLVQRYLSLSQVDRAVAMLLAMSWDTYPRACMHSLNQILNYLFKLPLTSDHENLIQTALGSFHVPVRPISQAIEEEYGDEVRDLTRRFFHHLLRYQLFEKAFRLAIDLNDHDLFMDIHFYALVLNDKEMAIAAKEKAEHILSRSNSCSSTHSMCSRESCSLCSDSASDKDNESYSEESEPSKGRDKSSGKNQNQIPPLPILHTPLYNSNSNMMMSTSFNDITPFSKPEYNFMSTSFGSSQNLNPTSENLLPNSLFNSTTFSKAPTYKSTPNLLSSSSISTTATSTDVFKPIVPEDDFMSTSFGNLSLSCLKSTSFSDSSYCKAPMPQPSIAEEGISPDAQDNNFISTSFNNPTYKSIDLPSSNDLMSTSFSVVTSSSTLFNSVTLSKSEIGGLPIRSPKTSGIPVPLNFPSTGFSDSASSSTISAFHNTSNLISTSFSTEEIPGEEKSGKSFFESKEASQAKTQNLPPEIPPPPPSLTSSLQNYLQSLPKKVHPLSKSTCGLSDIAESSLKFSSSRTSSINSQRILQRHDSASSILQQSQLRNNNILATRTYRLNYDLDYVPFHGSCENLDSTVAQHAKVNPMHSLHFLPSSYNLPNKSMDAKHSRLGNVMKEGKLSSNVPPLPVLNTPVCNSKPQSVCATDTPNEKPKVKFSDTVTHILVPGTGQSYRPIQKRSITQLHLTDPKRELAESLPLCLGNEDYLKDFQPLSKENETNKGKESVKPEETAKIKVVHFGLL